MYRRLADARDLKQRIGRTVVLKLKTADFHILTRSHTPPAPPQSQSEFMAMAVALLARVALPAITLYRLAGVGLHNFCEADELPPPELFGL